MSGSDTTRTIVVLGCGYVGLELCRQLTNDDPERRVIGVRRSEDGIAAIESAGATGVSADVTERESLESVPDADQLVFCASSGGGGPAVARALYCDGLKTVIEEFGSRDIPPEQLLYTSSTGVYGDHDGDWVDEETPIAPTTEKTRVLGDAERIARERPDEIGIDPTVVRFAGLYGPDRYRLDRYLDGPVTEGYLNMIHRSDAAGVLRFALSERPGEETLLAVDDEPVSKWAFADWLAEQCGVEYPPKQTKAERLADEDLSAAAKRRIETSKRCSNDRIRELGYEFAFPTYREGYAAPIENY